MNAPSNDCEQAAKDLGSLDTSRWSFLHLLFSDPPGRCITFWKSWFLPYSLTALLFFVCPFVVALNTLPATVNTMPGLKVPLLRDWNILFMYLVTMPILVMLLLTERSLIPSRIASVQKAGIIVLKDKESQRLCQQWTYRYGLVNLASQTAGVVIGIIVFFINYLLVSKKGYAGWQSTNGQINLAGWISLIWQLPMFYFIVAIYLGRAIATIAFLKSVIRASSVLVKPFHPDNAGGLSPIGRLGLRNQYVLAAGGLNLFLMLIVSQSLDPDPIIPILIVAAGMLYLVGSPLLFVGPLLPFRKSMLQRKKDDLNIVAERLREVYIKILRDLEESGIDKQHDDEIKRLQDLKAIVGRIPVWPFDVVTLRTFLGAYILPILAVIAAPFFGELVKFVTKMFVN